MTKHALQREKPFASVETRKAVAVGNEERGSSVKTSKAGLIEMTGYFQWKCRLHEKSEGPLVFLL